MKRRDFLRDTAITGLAAAAASGIVLGAEQKTEQKGVKESASGTPTMAGNKLTPPAKGRIPVAFLITAHATVIDFAGPWEVFQDVHVPVRGQTMDEQMPFQLYTVSEKIEPVTASAGMKLIPDYTFENAPPPKVVVIGAQAGTSPAMYEWLRKTSQTADVVMSVCTGAFVLARAGMLKGKTATTHHDFVERLEQEFPDITVKRGLRFVEGEKISTAGGLTSGIDLALRVVERYFGRAVAQATAVYMEYQSTGWMV